MLVACGGSKKPAESATESPATETSASAATDTPAGSESASADASTSPALGTSSTPEAPPTESAPTHPVPNSTGAIDGKPFVPKMARVTQAAQKDGRILLTLDERSECGGGDPKPGEGLLTLTVPWEDGYKQDLGSLKRAPKKGAEIAFVRVNTNGKKDASATFKPSGRVTVVKAPSEEGALGKINIDMQSGEYMLSGDLDVQVCVAPKSASAPAAAKPEKAEKPEKTEKPEKPKKKKKKE
jgi:hypothetical protein